LCLSCVALTEEFRYFICARIGLDRLNAQCGSNIDFTSYVTDMICESIVDSRGTSVDNLLYRFIGFMQLLLRERFMEPSQCEAARDAIIASSPYEDLEIDDLVSILQLKSSRLEFLKDLRSSERGLALYSKWKEWLEADLLFFLWSEQFYIRLLAALLGSQRPEDLRVREYWKLMLRAASGQRSRSSVSSAIWDRLKIRYDIDQAYGWKFMDMWGGNFKSIVEADRNLSEYLARGRGSS